MAKNYADIYNSTNVVVSLEQSFYLKEETTRGQIIAPAGTDFFFTLPGGGAEFSQPFFSSPQRSGRHHTTPIRQKKETSWTIPTYFNIDTTVGSPGVTEIDPAVRVLWKSLMGTEDVSSGLKFTPSTPNTTFTILEVSDKFSKQVRGGFVQGATMAFPGDGEATNEWTGNAKDVIYVGIGKSTSNNTGGNTFTLVTGDGGQFKKSAGGLAMIIKANGTSRSTDTPDGTPRTISSVVGDVVTLSGVALADADGSGVGTPVYLVYYEPATKTAINNPQTGLTGSLQITGLADHICMRNGTLTLTNDHELINYCYGSDSLDGSLFVPGNRFMAAISVESNLDKQMFKFFQNLQNFEAQVLQIQLGDTALRYLDIDIPKAIFETPVVSIPESGSVPVTYGGTAYQTVVDAADEISVHFK